MFRHSARFAATLFLLPAVGPVVGGTNAAAQEAPPTQTPSADDTRPTPAVQTLLVQGRRAFQATRFLDAARLVEKALARAQQTGDKRGEFVALFALGSVYHSLSQPQQSREFQEKALTLARQIGDKKGEFQVLVNLGLSYAASGQWKQDIDYQQQALAIARQTGDKKGEAATLLNTGFAYQRLDQPQKAVEYLQPALPLARQTGYAIAEEKTLLTLGMAYSDLKEKEKALDFFEQALPLAQQDGDKKQAIYSLTVIGTAFFRLGQPQKATVPLEQALPLLRQSGDKPGEVRCLNTVGAAYYNLGQPQKALEAYLKALVIARQGGDKSGESQTLSNLGYTYAKLGQRKKAADYQQQARTIVGQTGNTGGKAGARVILGIPYRDPGDPLQAVETLEKALSLARQNGNKPAEGRALYNLGGKYSAFGQHRQALRCYQQALPLLRQNNDTKSEVRCLDFIGAAYFALRQPQKALPSYQQALALVQQSSDKVMAGYTLEQIGRCYRRIKRFGESETAFRQSLTAYETIRSNLTLGAEARASFLESYFIAYRGLLATLLEQQTPVKTQEAFVLTQQMKARSLVETLTENGTLNTKLSDAERIELREKRAVCDRLNARLVEEGVTNEVGSKKRAEVLRTELAQAERDLSTFAEQLYARYPEAAASRATPVRTANQIAEILPPGTVLVEFVNGLGDNATLLVTTHDGLVGAFDVTLPRRQMKKAIADLRAGVIDPRTKDKTTNLAAWKAPARLLYNALFGPLEKAGRLQNVSHLVLCPVGPLWDVPFATLLDKEDRPLLSRFALTQAQSATLYRAAWERAKAQVQAQKNREPNREILTVADPAFAEYKSGFGNTPALAGQRPLPAPDRPLPTPDRPLPTADRPLPAPDRALLFPESLRGGKLAALPGTRREAGTIKALFPNASVLLGAQAQESIVKQLAPKYRFLHLATHGFVNDTVPLLSSLVLAEPPKNGSGSDEDGFLTARELLELDLSQVEMTVLSACNTARGGQQKGEGIVGLTWALFAAGCPTQVLSQWAVNDASTATLMTRFYTQLKAGTSKADALRQAALSVSRQPATAHPYYWAPFILIGNGE